MVRGFFMKFMKRVFFLSSLFLGLFVFQPAFAQQTLKCRDVFVTAGAVDAGGKTDSSNSKNERTERTRTLSEITASARRAGERVQMVEHRFAQGPSVFTGSLFHPRNSRPAHAQRTLTILIHGLADSHNSMMEIAEGLFQRGHNVMLVDLPFHGADLLKRFKDNDYREIKEEQIALDYEGFLRNLKETVAETAQREGFENIDVFGHSLGGGMAVWLTSLFEPIRYNGTDGTNGDVTRDLRIRNVHLAMPFYESAESTAIQAQLRTLSLGSRALADMWQAIYAAWTPTREAFYDSVLLPMVGGQWEKFARMSADHQSKGLSPEQQTNLVGTIKNVMRASAKWSSGLSVVPALQRLHGASVHLLGATQDPVVNATVIKHYREELVAAQKAGSIDQVIVEKPIEGSHLVPWFKPEAMVEWIQSGRLMEEDPAATREN